MGIFIRLHVKNQLNPVAKHPNFKAGDTVAVSTKIKRGRQRASEQFTGVLIQRKTDGSLTASFTVRKISNGVDWAYFPLASPLSKAST